MGNLLARVKGKFIEEGGMKKWIVGEITNADWPSSGNQLEQEHC